MFVSSKVVSDDPGSTIFMPFFTIEAQRKIMTCYKILFFFFSLSANLPIFEVYSSMNSTIKTLNDFLMFLAAERYARIDNRNMQKL